MIIRFRETVKSAKAPQDKTVLWLDDSIPTRPILRYWYADRWIALAGGGGGDIDPVIYDLSDYYYYGASDEIININDAQTEVLQLTQTKTTPSSCEFDKVYFYIAICAGQDISSVITSNNEDITSQFNEKGVFTINNKSYRLYEFYLNTLIPLNTSGTIRIIE